MFGLMPWWIASVRTKVLNDEPAWRVPCAARLNWTPRRPGMTAVIALMAPFLGLIETTAEAGSVRSVRFSLTARRAATWKRGSIVV